MYKKHLEHFLTVSLKCLFDFDYTVFHNAYLLVLMIPFMIKLLIVGMAAYLYDGLTTVKDDLKEIRTNAVTYRQQLHNSEMRETILHNIRSLKETLQQNSFRTR